MARLRLRFTTWPRPALELADSPRPNCPTCHGYGGWTEDYGHPETGEYDGTEFIPCPCWSPLHIVGRLPLPRWIASTKAAYSDEPPF